MELEINQITLSPRHQINSVPYALVAKSAEGLIAGTPGDSIPAGDINASSLTTSGDLTVSGSTTCTT